MSVTILDVLMRTLVDLGQLALSAYAIHQTKDYLKARLAVKGPESLPRKDGETDDAFV